MQRTFLRTVFLYAGMLLALVLLIIFVFPLGALAQTVEALWIPTGMCLFLVLFPIWVVGFNSTLFHGLFDMDLSPVKRLPVRHFLVTLMAFAVSGSAWSIFRLMLIAGPDRLGPGRTGIQLTHWKWVKSVTDLEDAITFDKLAAAILPPLILAAFFAAFAVVVSWKQDKRRRPLSRIISGTAAALVLGSLIELGFLIAAHWWMQHHQTVPQLPRLLAWLLAGFHRGYSSYLAEHEFAGAVALIASVLYAVLGIIGYKRLGSSHTVSALGGPLMAVLTLGWIGAASQFFLYGGPVPLLAVILVGGIVNTWIPFADHIYEMVPRNKARKPAPEEVWASIKSDRAILVASAGGGIQAAAWTAQVLQGLDELHKEKFRSALTLISSISGGSMGSACYVNWLAQGAGNSGLPLPFEAASNSSLDEAAWGLAWPDLLRLFLSWPFGFFIDRAHALERAWLGNATGKPPEQTQGTGLDAALSDWNECVSRGELPALIMNSTIVETGGPLLLGTSKVALKPVPGHTRKQNPWMDGDDLHRQHGREMDIPVVRAARLSATFPFVTPAAKPANALKQPHMMDGGFYDNYGMATLIEWLDQALETQPTRDGKPKITQVLVLQINGFPPPDYQIPPPAKTSGGWFKQLRSPVDILLNVRTAGQVSHRDMELKLLMEKWKDRGVTITSEDFELAKQDAPLSWHLMPEQIRAIADGWHAPPGSHVAAAKQAVDQFLNRPGPPPPDDPTNHRIPVISPPSDITDPRLEPADTV
jgi:hypothetical protein